MSALDPAAEGAVPDGADNVVQLGLNRQANDSMSIATGKIRRHLSLLQGYADLMEGVSPEQAVSVMRIMADKVEDLTDTIRPFLDASRDNRPGIDRYRKARAENRDLMAEYRLLLSRLRHSVSSARQVVPPRD